MKWFLFGDQMILSALILWLLIINMFYAHEVWIWWYVLTIVYSVSFGSVTLVDRTMTEGGYRWGKRGDKILLLFGPFTSYPSKEPSHKAKVRKGVLTFIFAKTKSTFYASVLCCCTWFSRTCYPGHKSNSQWLRTELCPMWIHCEPQDSVDWVKQAPVTIDVGFFLAELAGILDHSASHWSFLFIDYWIIRALLYVTSSI